MTGQTRRDWLAGPSRHDMTCICERALRAAAGITWQHLGAVASGRASPLGRDYYHPARSVIAEYLRHTGRMEEAAEVEAIGCSEPPPHTGFAAMSETTLAGIRLAMREG